jgi:hypothetical protein
MKLTSKDAIERELRSNYDFQYIDDVINFANRFGGAIILLIALVIFYFLK